MTLIPKNILLVFLKYPHPGCVKTRLAKSIGDVEAAVAYKKMAQVVVEQTTSTIYHQILLIHPPEQHQAFKVWLGEQKNYCPQVSGTLDQKLVAAFSDCFDKGAQSVIVIGSDCIDIVEDDIKTVFQHLVHAETVIGPARDGGYYLLGLTAQVYQALNNDLALLFYDIPWSTPEVYTQTVDRLKKYGFHPVVLPEKQDIDEVAELHLLEARP